MRKGIVYLPNYSHGNPYQKLLYSEIEAAGIPCNGLRGKDFTFQWIWRSRSEYRYIHLHWLNGVYDPLKSGLTHLKALLFIAKIVFSRLLGYKLLWTAHNLIAHESANIKLDVLVSKLTARLVNHVIVHCNFAKTEILRLWRVSNDKIIIIPHGSYVGYYPDFVSRSDARQQLGIADNEVTFLFVGMLRKYKGIESLIESFKKLKIKHPNIRLIIAGSPNNFTIEDTAAHDSISTYLRHIPDEEMQYFFKAADFVTLPYANILTSGAAILAISFGKPVIAPAKGCLPELITNEIGFLFDRNKDLIMAMTEAIGKSDITGMGEKAMAHAKALSWKSIVTTYYLPLFVNK